MPVRSTISDDRPPEPRRWRRLRPVAALLILGFAVLGCGDPAGVVAASDSAPATTLAAPTTTATSGPATTAAPSTAPRVEVPALAGMQLAGAKRRLAARGLELRVRYRRTARYVAGTVISQSRRIGADVAPSAVITLVIAKALPPPPTTQPPATTPSRNCDPAYPGVCLDPTAEDYDCAGGSGNGPRYVQGPVQVRPPDPFDLDADADGIGCERD
jgi:PASTA domain